MAVVRGNLGGFPVILASATPSIESHVNARTGRYRHVVLPARFSGAALPEVTAIDLRRNPPEKGKWLSPVLVEAIAADAGSQAADAAVPQPARLRAADAVPHLRPPHRVPAVHGLAGRAPLPRAAALPPLRLLDPAAGEVPEAAASRARSLPAGRAWSASPRRWPSAFPRRGWRCSPPTSCPASPRCARSSATIEAGGIDIVIGTQMVAKGHHFPHLATVGIVDGDLGLAMGADPRAGERTFQLLHQVTGRAGRALAEGRGFVQTYSPEHPVMAAIIAERPRGVPGAGDRGAPRAGCCRRSGGSPRSSCRRATRRRRISSPATSRIARRRPSASRSWVRRRRRSSVIRGRHRWRLLVKAPREIDVQAYLRAWLGGDAAAEGRHPPHRRHRSV